MNWCCVPEPQDLVSFLMIYQSLLFRWERELQFCSWSSASSPWPQHCFVLLLQPFIVFNEFSKVTAVSCCVVSGHSQSVELEFLATQRQFRRNCWVGKAQAGDCERGNSASLTTCQHTVVPQPVLFIFNRWTQSAYCELRSFTIWLMMHFWLCLCLWLKRYVNYQIVSLHLYQHLPALNFLLLLCGDYSLYVVFTELALERSALLQFLLTLGFIDLFFVLTYHDYYWKSFVCCCSCSLILLCLVFLWYCLLVSSQVVVGSSGFCGFSSIFSKLMCTASFKGFPLYKLVFNWLFHSRIISTLN